MAADGEDEDIDMKPMPNFQRERPPHMDQEQEDQDEDEIQEVPRIGVKKERTDLGSRIRPVDVDEVSLYPCNWKMMGMLIRTDDSA